MIERIQIQNYQKHDKLRVTFDENITTIVGPSDTGKSSVLRAIRWVAFNRPLGDGFIRNGETSCSVKLWVDGRKIERRKSKGKNVYTIDGKRLSAVGANVPEEVKALLNLTVENFQGQHDAMFWFSLTPGEVGKRLNAIVDLEVIDRSASYLASKLRKGKIECELIEKRLAEANEERGRLAFVDDMAEDFELLRICQGSRKSILVNQQGLRKCLDGLESASQRREKLAAAANEYDIVLGAAGSLGSMWERLSALYGVIDRVKSIKAHADRLKSELEAAEKELEEKTGGVCPICGGPLE